MNTPKCSTCRDTGHRDPSSFDLDCTDCDVAEQRVALNKFAEEQKGVSLYQADRHWAIHQRALAMAPNQEAPAQEPVAHLKFWAAQSWSGNGNHDVECGEGLEVFEAGEIGADKLPAFPVYRAPAAANGALTDERAAFEASSPTMHIKRNKYGLYENLYVHHAWLAWQARAALNSPAASNGERADMQAMKEEIRRLRAMLFPEKPEETTGWTIVPLKSIYSLLNLIDPPPVEANGKTMVFVNPHAAEVLTWISAEVRAMMAAKPSVDAQAGARGAA